MLVSYFENVLSRDICYHGNIRSCATAPLGLSVDLQGNKRMPGLASMKTTKSAFVSSVQATRSVLNTNHLPSIYGVYLEILNQIALLVSEQGALFSLF